MKKILIATAALTAFSAPALAQEATNFGGAKIGAVIGYDKVRLEALGDDGSKDGFLYGVNAGYDFDLGTALVGIEGELADSTTKEGAEDVFVLGDEISLHAARDLYIGARVGFPVSDNVLLYAKAGYTNARVKLKYDDGVDTFTEGRNLDGWRVGAGAEYVMAQTFARLEYRYSEYENNDDLGATIEPSRHQVALIAGFRF
ncbi:Opacity protein precursor [Sphingomonas paucimobilis]|nr:Opacity protein precursor [Sphingomonas paucimobilis]